MSADLTRLKHLLRYELAEAQVARHNLTNAREIKTQAVKRDDDMIINLAAAAIEEYRGRYMHVCAALGDALMDNLALMEADAQQTSVNGSSEGTTNDHNS